MIPSLRAEMRLGKDTAAVTGYGISWNVVNSAVCFILSSLHPRRLFGLPSLPSKS